MLRRAGFGFFALIVLICLIPVYKAADTGGTAEAESYLNIATVDSRPLSNDRLLYSAFKELGLQSAYLPMTLDTGLSMAAIGELDGIIVSSRDGGPLDGLVIVPAELESIRLFAYVREDSGIVINSWADLSGKVVGVDLQKVFDVSNIPAGASIIERDNPSQIMLDLAEGVCDVAVIPGRGHESFRIPAGITTAAVLDTLTDYLYLSEKNAHLAQPMKETLDRFFLDGRAESILSDSASIAKNGKRTVLHITSAHWDVAREAKIRDTITARFDGDSTVEWYTMALESRRFSRLNDTMTGFAHILRQEFLTRDTAAIIVSGDDALRFLMSYYNLYFMNVPVLFYGVCDEYDSIIRGYEQNFSGLIDSIAVYDTVYEALRLFPDTKNLLVINDFMTEGTHYRKLIERRLEPLYGRLNVIYNDNVTIAELAEQVRGLPEDSLILIGSYFVDSDGLFYPVNEVTLMLEQNAAVPILSFYSTELSYGALGGRCLDYEQHGIVLAGKLRQILDGVPVTQLPVTEDTYKHNVWVFDKTKLDKFAISEKNLPPEHIILNGRVSIWESDPRFAAAVVSLIAAGIIILITVSILLIRYNKHKQLLEKDAEIRTVKERLEHIINTAPLAYLMTIDGVIVETNEYARLTFGKDVGSEVITLYKDPAQRTELAKQVDEYESIKNRILNFVLPGGAAHRFVSNVSSIDYGGNLAYMLWAMDIEDNERKNDQLLTARKNVQDIIDSIPVPVRISSIKNASIMYVNNACLRLFECSAGDMLGKPLTAHMRDGESIDLELLLQPFLDAEQFISRELEYVTAGGKLLEMRVTTCKIVYEGEPALVAILDDLTAEKEQKRLLEKAAVKEKEANQLKSRFLVNMSHEIRTPMNAIIGLTEIELRKKRIEDPREIYTKINTSAKNLLEIINDILDLSKIEADKMELYAEEFELEDVLNSALLVAAPRLDGKNVEFLLNAALDLPRYIVGDKTRLWQILKNFLDNSAKYTDTGKIVLSASINESRSDEDTVTIDFSVSDTGIGMSEDQLRRIFMPYAQVQNEAQKRYTGTGLGLVISKQLCELMGGEMQIKSEQGSGTSIHISIPFVRSKNTDTELTAIKTGVLAGLKILTVDDDPMSLDIMRTLLRGNDAFCMSAASGEEALEIILKYRDEGKAFDAILLDYMMDGINGIETARRIQRSLSKAPKLLMVTAYQKLLLRNELESNGFNGIIEKPFIPSLFVSKLCAALGLAFDGGGEDEAPGLEQYKDVHILLCEDYIINQEVALGMLSQFGITATVAENGKEGLEILKSGEKHFDLVFMDLQMPVMDGYEATRQIRADPAFDKLPIISLTADAMKEIVDKCLETGMNDHVAKPIDFENLSRVFKTWLPGNKRAGSQTTALPEQSTDDAMARFGGDIIRYENALKSFAGRLPDEWPELKSDSKETDALLKEIHKIKGAAGNLAQNKIFRTAADLESALRNNSPAAELYAEFISACAEVRAAVFAGE